MSVIRANQNMTMFINTFVHMQNHNSSGGKSGKKKGLCFLDQMRQANSIIGWCSSIQTQIQMQIQFQIQIQIPIPDQSDPHLEPCLCTSLIFISLNLVCCSSASVEKGARMLVSVSTAFKFLLLKFMSAKVIFHIVFPAAQCHPSVFFCRVSRFLIVSFSVFPLFRVLFVDAGGHGYRGGFFGFGFGFLGADSANKEARKPLARNWQLFFYFCVCHLSRRQLPAKVFATCAPGDKSNADLLCGSFEWRRLVGKVKYTEKIGILLCLSPLIFYKFYFKKSFGN